MTGQNARVEVIPEDAPTEPVVAAIFAMATAIHGLVGAANRLRIEQGGGPGRWGADNYWSVRLRWNGAWIDIGTTVGTREEALVCMRDYFFSALVLEQDDLESDIAFVRQRGASHRNRQGPMSVERLEERVAEIDAVLKACASQ